MIDNPIADTLIYVNQIADMLTVDSPTATAQFAKMSALPQILFNVTIAINSATSVKFAHHERRHNDHSLYHCNRSLFPGRDDRYKD